jgi:hypothetical protein
MANRKISDLTALTAPATGDLLPIVDISEAAAADKNKKITYGELLASAPDGSAAAPSFSFDSDPNSGIYSSGADQVSFATNGTERFRVDSAGQLKAVSLGTAAAPTFSFTGDPNTGIYSPGADQLAISTGGTGRLFVDASGNVGVGTTVAAGKLSVSTSSSNGSTLGSGSVWNDGFFIVSPSASTNSSAIALSYDTTTNLGNITCVSPGVAWREITYRGDGHRFYTGGINEKVRIDSSGRLLVGTSSVTGVQHSAAAGTFDVDPQSQINTLSNPCALLLRTDFPSNESGSLLALAKSRGSSINSNTLVASGDTLGEIGFFGADGTDIRSGAASIQCRVDGTPGANDMPGRLVFSVTADGASSPTEALRIKNSRIINIANTPVYADNAAAKTGGLVNGDVYRKSDGTLMIVYT